MMKCSFCKSCLRIRRVERGNWIKNYLVCGFCGRIYDNNPHSVEEVKGEEAEYARSYLGLTKVGSDDENSG